MRARKANRKATFFWQALLIVLPVIVLATFGFLSLRQDKVLAQNEAAERAQGIADNLLPRLWTALTQIDIRQELGGYPAFQVDTAGQLLFPPPMAPWPVARPFDGAGLTVEQARLWRTAQRAEAEKQNAVAAQAYQDLLSLNPSKDFSAAAHYSLGLLWAKEDRIKEAVENLRMILEKFPDSTGESGMPLQPLARLKLLELQTNRFASNLVSINSFCSNVVNNPTPLTPSLVGEVLRMSPSSGNAAVQDWQRIWEEHERKRHLYAAACKHFGGGLLSHLTGETGGAQEMLLAKRSKESRRLGSPGPVKLTSAPLSTPSVSRVGPRLFWFISTEVAGRDAMNPGEFVGSSPTLVPRAASNDPQSGTQAPPESTTASNTSQVANPDSPLSQGEDWLAIRCEETPTNCWLACLPVEQAINQLSSVAERASPIPEYFGIMFELAGKTFARSPRELQMWIEHHYGGKGGGWDRTYSEADASDAELLGSAAEAESGAELLRVNVYLTSPTTLYARQRARTFWFAALISVAAVAALAGLITAWRVFHRQQLLSELKTNFVSSVSHELRSPLASVRLMAETLERGKVSEPPKQQEYFRFIVQECRRLSSLVENVLDFSRIEQGRKEYEFEPADLAALAQQTVKLMEPYAAERQVKLALVLPDHQPSTIHYQLAVDGKAIQQALVNLIDNAIKHSPKGGTVKVGLESVECRGAGEQPNGGTSNLEPRTLNHEQKNLESDHQSPLTLWVEDHGEGIPSEEHEKIFERFYRRGSELRRETQGVGIGLSIVKHIVEAHGGKVLVHSSVGQGSRFTIELLAVTNPKSE